MSNNSENNPQNPNYSPSEEEQQEGFQLPDPDLDNVTVLTDNLPNNPILPWHHYDSPWVDNETEDTSEEN